MERPQQKESSADRRLGGDTLSWERRECPRPGSDSSPQGAKQTWSVQDVWWGWALTGNSLPGLCWGLWDQGQPEVLPKPSIRADPGTMDAQGSPVTIWCQGSLLADVYRLYKERGSVYLEAKAPQGSRNKARFHFASSSSSEAGQYQCAYHTRHSWSEQSDPLPLVVTGMHRKPSLSARPGASVPRGENVTLQCHSEVQSDTFHLSKQGSLAAPQHLRLQDTAPPVQANFTLRAVTSAHSGTYRCYSSQSTAPHLLSLPSDPLELHVSGSSWGLQTPPTSASSTSAE
ncbi:leukocyte immunoglobulin-like receptor subfamily B member 4 [Oryx dammah]|uniref:leukocyte immunoglobulin-like receptor subfamily B member 4 n=1 Tax=Oryx dammah TaxID=59534 RepID=UPI001A9B113F|nr:leukocyte immunoglobulin-like receptor subfamily B member 4 [Oryx dammah]